MALLTVQAVTTAGLEATYSAAAGGGDTIAGCDDGRVFLHVKNGHTSPQSVTIADPGVTPAGNDGTPVAVSVTNAEERFILIPPGAVDPATGLVSVSYSGVTALTVAAIRR